MKPRHIAAKMFLVLAILCSLVGVVLFARNMIGNGLTWKEDLNPLFLLYIPSLVPFAAAIGSACFGLVYFGLEKKFNRPINTALAIVHLTAYLLLILGHAILLRFLWRVLGEGSSTNATLPSWAGLLEFAGLVTCCTAFGMNILKSVSRTQLTARNPR